MSNNANLNISLLTLTPKIGVIPADQSKFDSWSGTSGYYRKPDYKYDPYKTDKMHSGGFTKSGTIPPTACCIAIICIARSAYFFPHHRISGKCNIMRDDEK